jgi:hypothetical protein
MICRITRKYAKKSPSGSGLAVAFPVTMGAVSLGITVGGIHNHGVGRGKVGPDSGDFGAIDQHVAGLEPPIWDRGGDVAALDEDSCPAGCALAVVVNPEMEIRQRRPPPSIAIVVQLPLNPPTVFCRLSQLR